LLTTFAACSFAPPPLQPRPPLAARDLGVAIGEVPVPTLESLREEAPGRFSGTLAGGGETVAFHLNAANGDGRATVLLVPILAGGDDLLEQVGQRVQARGFDVAYCERAGSALKTGQRGKDLDELFRRTVLHQRLLLRWLRERPAASPQQFVLGMSLGGMVTTVLAAAEPDLAGIAICLSGGDLKDLVMTSSEGRVQRWRAWRQSEDGIGDDALRWELGECLTHEPLRYAPMIATERVLLVEAALDTVVPARNQALLWEALGRPARFTVPLGHYTAALAIDLIIAKVTQHFAERQRLPAAAPERLTSVQGM
jgi:pimeloyl-ACP methyl ester carboxylesterase